MSSTINVLLLGTLFLAVVSQASQMLESNLQPGGFYMGKAEPGSVVIFKGLPVLLASL